MVEAEQTAVVTATSNRILVRVNVILHGRVEFQEPYRRVRDRLLALDSGRIVNLKHHHSDHRQRPGTGRAGDGVVGRMDRFVLPWHRDQRRGTSGCPVHRECLLGMDHRYRSWDDDRGTTGKTGGRVPEIVPAYLWEQAQTQ